ncbi:MAG TPA: hypothetical protein VJN69_14870 [Candidatus Acidoferrales bacterium]|nr:hypothetical protein [Candidatus Acidoferrales bacterium]
MMFRLPIRQVATALLRGALKIAPPHAAEWGRAMLAELHHIESEWSALAWSIGSAGVLTKHAFLALFVTSNTQTEGNFFRKEKPMRKSTAIAAAVCIAASLLFFAAPTFRDAFQLSVTQWRGLMRAAFSTRSAYSFDPGLDHDKIARLARQNHDAEELAFAALHGRSGHSTTEQAEEAVRIDPQLTWIYAVLANWHRPEPNIDEWISMLHKFDPQNAVPYLIQAEVVETNDIFVRKLPYRGYLTDPAWLNAMASAFASPKIDTYGDRVKNLDREVAQRYGIYDAHAAQNEYFLIAGAFPGLGNTNDYVTLLVDSGNNFAARGDYAGAEKQYRRAAHFGEMVEDSRSVSPTPYRYSALAAMLLQGPYRQLGALYEKKGDAVQARHFADLLVDGERVRRDDLARAQVYFESRPTENRNAGILGVAGIVMFLCFAILPLCAIVTVARSGSIRLSKLRSGAFTRVFARSSVIGLLISTAALYLTYRPYAEMFRTYLRGGDPTSLLTVAAFLNDLDYSQTPPPHQALYSLWTFPMYFWAGVIVLCFVALALVTAKFIWQRRPELPA